MISESIVDGFLAECGDDYVGLWSLIWDVKNYAPNVSGLDMRIHVLELLKKLLEDGKIVVGSTSGEGEFIEWSSQANKSIEVIENAWLELNREPNIGEIAWFTTPDYKEV